MYNSEMTQEQIEAQRKEQAFRKAREVMFNLNYNTVQEMLVDLLTEGVYTKETGEWVEITDPAEIQTNRNHINLAQAKYYGLKITRAEDSE